MLQQIRDRSQSMIAKIVVGAVVIALALFGIESVVGLFTSGSDDVVEVNGEPITRQQIEVEVQRGIRSGQVPPEQERELRRQVIEQQISRELLDQYAENGGLYISDQQLDQVIVTLPQFQGNDGKFSTELFRNRLTSAGYTPLAFRQQLRTDLMRQQLQQGLTESAFLLENERNQLVALQNQTRSFRYHLLEPDDLEGDVTITEADIQQYYDDHQAAYQRPEQVRINYVVLDQADMADPEAVDEQALEDAYAERQREADRRVSHIMVTFGDERSREEARARLEEVQKRLQAGDDFADLAAQYSDDATTADSDGDLGIVSRGFFGESFEDAAFSLKEEQVSDIVETDNGLHLLKVTDINLPPLDDMRDTLKKDLALGQARDRFNDKAQRLIDESFAAEDLASVAEDLDLQLQRSGWVSRDSTDGVLAEPGVMKAAFSPEVLEDGYNSDVLELDDQRRLVLRVADHREATTLSLDEVRDQVRDEVRAQKVREALQEKAAQLARALRDGQAPDLDWQRAESVSRQAADVPEPVLNTAFQLPRPDQGTTYGHADLGRNVALIALTDVQPGEQAGGNDQSAFAVQLAQRLRSQAAFQGLLESLRDEAEIERL